MARQSRRLCRLGMLISLGCLFWTGLYNLSVQAAPLVTAVSVSPASGPRGSVFRIYGTELGANSQVQTRIRRADGSTTPSLTYTADASGQLGVPYLSRAEDPTGIYTVELQVANTLPVTATFSVSLPTQPTLAVFPTFGSPANTFRFIGAGYTPAQPIDLILERPDGLSLTLQSGATLAGGLEANLAGGGLPRGPYSVTALVNGSQVGRVEFRIEALPAFCRDLLRNPGFEEQPNLIFWDQQGDPFVSNQGAFSGARVAVLGGYDNALDAVFQPVSIPADTQSAELSYWRARVPENNPGADQMRVFLAATSGQMLETLETVGAGSTAGFWERRVVSLDYPGETIALNFEAMTDAANSTAYGVDETSLIACSQLAPQSVGPQAATMRALPSQTTVAPGGRVTVDVWIENAANLFGADVTLHFDPALLRPRANQVRVGGWLNAPGALVTRNQVNAEQGTAQLVLTRIAPMPAVSGSGVLFSLDFDVLALGVSPLDLTPVRVSAPGGVPVTLSIATTNVSITQPLARLGGQLRLGGRLDHSGVTLQVTGSGTGSATSNTLGDYRVDGLTPGVATVTARRLGWLCATREVVLTPGVLATLPLVELVPGDVNGDDDINIFDLVRVAFRYDDPASVEPAADLNGNGVIDLGDLVLVAAHYGRDCPTPWAAPAAKRAPRPTKLPRLTLVPQSPTPDGVTTVEVWAEDSAKIGGLDLTLSGDVTFVDPGFSLGPALQDAFVARNRVDGKTGRLALALLEPTPALQGKVHVASLTLRGDVKSLRIGRVVWAGAGGAWVIDSLASASPIGPAKSIVSSDKAGVEPGPAWQRPARLPHR